MDFKTEIDLKKKQVGTGFLWKISSRKLRCEMDLGINFILISYHNACMDMQAIELWNPTKILLILSE
jgi:hypothetical protein